MLNVSQLKEISEIYEKWGLKRGIYLENSSVFEKIDFSPLIDAFTTRLKTISCKFSHSEEVSGAICYFGGITTSLLHFGYVEEIEGLFTFALCYMLIDHYLDDNNISEDEKKKSMKDIYNFIYKGERNCENK